MDVLEIYTKQCEKAEEIQEIWKPIGGDWYIHDYRGTTRTSRQFERQIWGDSDKTWQIIEIMCYRPSESKDVVISTDGKESRCVAVVDLVKEHSIWLPRQDQLQEMIIGDYTFEPIGCLLNDFEQWRGEYGHNQLTTGEQLWLAFVMKSLYNKIWSKEKKEWIKEAN